MESKDLGGNDKKFMFDMNYFDDDHEVEEEIEEDLPPPPPTFSEEELAEARRKAYDEGYTKGKADEIGSREQVVSKTLNAISQQIAPLVAAEVERDQRYEQEAVHLALHIFKVMYPHYEERCGFEELRETLGSILEKQRTHKTIKVFVAADMVEGIDSQMQTLSAQSEMSYEVHADDTLSGTECRLSWKDGGAIYSPQKTAEQVLEILKQTLAQNGFTGHDEGEGIEKQTDAVKNDIVKEEGSENELPAQDDVGPDNEPEMMEKPDE